MPARPLPYSIFDDEIFISDSSTSSLRNDSASELTDFEEDEALSETS